MDKKTIVLGVLAIILLGGLFVYFKPQSPDQSKIMSPDLQEKVFEIIVKNGKVLTDTAVMKAQEGGRVVLKITLDKDDEVHLHGYDLLLPVQKDVQGKMSFMANITGRFDLGLHGSHLNLGVIEVFPK